MCTEEGLWDQPRGKSRREKSVLDTISMIALVDQAGSSGKKPVLLSLKWLGFPSCFNQPWAGGSRSGKHDLGQESSLLVVLKGPPNPVSTEP